MLPETQTIGTSLIADITSLQSSFDFFQNASIDDAKRIGLSERFDTKFLFPISVLPHILKEAAPYYKLVSEAGTHIFGYHSQYFDTRNFDMYLDHHNDKLNRIKIRRREYLNSGKLFFEIKLFTNRGKTKKKRFETENRHIVLSKAERKFVKTNTLFKHRDLIHTFTNHYQRITLLSKDGRQRVTFDFGMLNEFGENSLEMPHLVIAEIKQSNCSYTMGMQNILREINIRPTNFSKYCIGLALLHPQLKRNNFKSTFEQIKKYKI